MKRIMILIGPPGSGKSTLAKEFQAKGYIRISQDDMGREGHLKAFKDALNQEQSIVIDRLNFNKEQRSRYIPPEVSGYIVECIVLHENRATCLKRMSERQGHPTIKSDREAGSALNTFFKGYERPSKDEGFHNIEFRYPKNRKQVSCIVTDLDGTIANLDHRLHFIHPPEGVKKNWKEFLSRCDQDTPKEDVIDVILSTYIGYGEHGNLVACSGRGDEYRDKTQAWLDEHLPICSGLFMRERGDYRDDSIVKENLLDFEILTRYHRVACVFDDRDRVVAMWRRRNILCLQVAFGEF